MAEKSNFGNLMSAGAGRRFIAWIIDQVIIWVLVFFAIYYYGDWISQNIFGRGVMDVYDFIGFFLIFSFLIGCINFLYNLVLEAIRGQTLGKMFTVTVNVGGKKKITADRAVIRAFYKTFLSFIFILQLIDFILIYTDERSLGDRISMTCVVNADSWRQKQYSNKRDAKQPVKSFKAYAKCTACGAQVPVHADGSGICPKCRKAHVGK